MNYTKDEIMSAMNRIEYRARESYWFGFNGNNFLTDHENKDEKAIGVIRSVVTESIQKSGNESFGKWILCSEKLPDYDESVLVTDNYCGVFIAWYSAIHGWCSDTYVCCDVVAWMPLPEPYEGETK